MNQHIRKSGDEMINDVRESMENIEEVNSASIKGSEPMIEKDHQYVITYEVGEGLSEYASENRFSFKTNPERHNELYFDGSKKTYRFPEQRKELIGDMEQIIHDAMKREE